MRKYDKNEPHTQYAVLKYGWKLFLNDEQIAIGAFETKAPMQYKSQEAFLAGDAPVKVFHKSAYMKSRKQAENTLEALGKLPIGRRWGKWDFDKEQGFGTVPLLVDGEAAFCLHLQVN